ncbi:MAG: molybdate ABC transporter substrate-binding protein [Coriobacteriia bacterium]|nr:molybdate ABC transporter substrate-binding protein [Coriobacteriia bacterium]
MVFTRTKTKSVKKRAGALVLSVMLLAVSAMALVACGGNTATEAHNEPANNEAQVEAVELQVFAANSLERALPEVQALYTGQNPHITFKDTQFKGSGDLVTELQGGAPADILITASSSTMNTAGENGSIDEATRIDLFVNDLIVVKQEGSDITLGSLAELQSDEITKVAIGDADAVPAGAYANQSLFSVDLYSDESGKGGAYTGGFETKVIIQSSVGNVAKTVSTGDVQIGFVYSSDLYRYDGIEQLFVVPSDTHKPIIYPGAVVSDSANAQEAERFLEFCLNDPEALKIWAQFGFELI